MIYVLILDVVVASLLAVTIAACFRLNTRIKVLQDGKSELRRLIDEFNAASERAETGIAQLNAATKKSVETLQLKIDRANYLAEDMHFMIEKGGKVADKLETNLTGNRKGSGTPPSRPAAASALAERGSPQPRLASSLQGGEKLFNEVTSQASSPRAARGIEAIARKTAAAATGDREEKSMPKTSAAIESVLEKISNKRSQETEKKPVVTARPRSHAERELLQALRANR